MRRALVLALCVAAKDCRLFLADRRAVAMCFAVPVLLASAFGLIFRHAGDRLGATRLPMLVAAGDDSPLARQVVADLVAGPHADATQVTPSEAAERVGRSGGVAVVVSAAVSGEEEQSVEPPELPRFAAVPRVPRLRVELIHHPLAAVESQWAEGVVTEAVMRRAAEVAFGPWLKTPVAELLNRPFELTRRPVPAEARAFDAVSHSFCGMTLQYLLFWGMESGLLLLRERRGGVWQRLRAAPVPLAALLGGKAAATALIGLALVAATFLFGRVAFGVGVSGSWLGFGALAVAVSLMAAAAGLLVAALGGTEARARSVSVLVILTVAMLGGLWLPSFLLPAWVQQAALALPTTWAMNGLDAVTWQGLPLGAVMPSLLAVLAFDAVFLTLALACFARLEARARRGETP